jgi:hypothetical protein
MTKHSGTKLTKVEKSLSSQDSRDSQETSDLIIDSDDMNGREQSISKKKSSEIKKSESSKLSLDKAADSGEQDLDVSAISPPNERSSKATSYSSPATAANEDIIDIDDEIETKDRDQETPIMKPSKKNRSKMTTSLNDKIADYNRKSYAVKKEDNAETPMVIIFDDDEDIQALPEDTGDTISEIDDQIFDHLAKTTFVVIKLHDVVDRKFLDSAGISILKPVLNVELATAESEKVVLSIWGENANNVQAWME